MTEKVKASEIFIGPAYPLRISKEYGRTAQTNLTRTQTTGGGIRTTKHGDSARVRSYTILANPTQRAGVEEAFEHLDGYSKNLWLTDHDGETYMVYMDAPDKGIDNNQKIYYYDVTFVEG